MTVRRPPLASALVLALLAAVVVPATPRARAQAPQDVVAGREALYDELFNDPEFSGGGVTTDPTASGSYIDTSTIVDQGTKLLGYGKYLTKLAGFASSNGLGEEVAAEITEYSAQVTELGQQLRSAERIRLSSDQAATFVAASVFAIGKSLRLIGESLTEGDQQSRDALRHTGQTMVVVAQNIREIADEGRTNGGNIDIQSYERQLAAVEWLLIATRAIDTSMRTGRWVEARISSSVSAERGQTYQLISFSAIDTVDALGAISQNNLLWDFGDGELQTGMFVTHPFSTPNRYPVQLYALGPSGFGMASTTIKIEPVKPVAVISTDQESLVGPHDDALTVVQGQSVLFSGKNSFDPSDPKRTFTYTWDFGDGSTEDTKGITVTHSFADAREYQVILTVETEAGLSAAAFKILRVLPTPPTPRMTVRREGDTLEAGVAKDFFMDHASGPMTLIFSAAKSQGAPTASGRTKLVQALWDFGDGTRTEQSERDLAASQTVKHTYNRPGRYVATVTITDDQNSAAEAEKTIVLLEPSTPTSDFTSDVGAEVTTHREMRFDGSAARSSYAPIIQYRWELRPVKQEPLATGTSKTFAASVNAPGAYEVSLITKDANGEESPSAVQRLNVLSTAPRAGFVFRRTAEEPNVFAFDASSSTDPDGDALSYSWDFDGDGTYDVMKSANPEARRLFDRVGKNTVTLRVTDSFNRSSTVTRTVQVDSALVVRIQTDQATPPAGPTPLTVKLTGAAYLNLSGGRDVNNVRRLEWDFGDGTREGVDTTDGTSTVTHTFRSAVGLTPHTVTLTATDAAGNRRRTSLRVSVGQPNEVVPVIAVAPELPELGTTTTQYEFSALGSVSPKGLQTGLTANWDFGDGSGIASGMRATHSFPRPGTYTVTLTLTDSASGRLGRLTRTLEVQREPATALFFAGPLEGVAPLEVTLDASSSSDPNGAIQSYTWSFGDGAVIQQPAARTTHVYSKAGTYTVRLTIVDSAGSKVESEPATLTVR